MEPRLHGRALRGPETVLPELPADDDSGGADIDADRCAERLCAHPLALSRSDALFTLLLVGFIPFQVVLLPMARTLGAVGLSDSVWV